MPLLGSQEAGEGSIPTAAGADSPGVVPPVVTPTLAAVYAAGAGAPAADDIMAMQGATATFQANSDALPLPLAALWETDQSHDLNAQPAEVTSLATRLSVLIGFRLFNAYEMFDAAWDGTFQKLANYGWEIEKVSFQGSAATHWRNSNVFSQRDYLATWNFPPEAEPTDPNLQQGALLHRLFLYNTIDASNQEVDEIDGWGQHRTALNPPQHGITWDHTSHVQFRLASGGATQVGDGTGFAIFESALSHTGGDHKRGALWCKALDLLGNWEWSIAVNDGSDNWLSVAAFSKTAITFNTPVALPASSRFADGGAVAEVYQAVVDGTALGTTQIIPARAGFTFFGIRWALYMLSGAGTATSSLILQVGNNGATFNNQIGPITTPTSSLNPSEALAPVQLTSGAANGQVALADGAAPSMVNVTTKAAGMTICSVLLIFHGIWRPT